MPCYPFNRKKTNNNQTNKKTWGDYKQGQDDFWYNMYNEIQAVCFQLLLLLCREGPHFSPES